MRGSYHDWYKILDFCEGNTLVEKVQYLSDTHRTMTYPEIGEKLGVNHKTVQNLFQRYGIHKNQNGDISGERFWNYKLRAYEGDTIADKIKNCIDSHGNINRASKALGTSFHRVNKLVVSLGRKEKSKFKVREVFGDYPDYKGQLEDYMSQYGNVYDIQMYLRKHPVYSQDEFQQVLNDFKKSGNGG